MIKTVVMANLSNKLQNIDQKNLDIIFLGCLIELRF